MRLFPILCLLCSMPALAQTRYYVRADAPTTQTGLSWAAAYNDLNMALTTAQSGDEIWVAAGQYLPTSGIDRTLSFVQKSGVRLYGGFSGTEVNLNERDYTLHKTILSGNIGAIEDSTDNAYTILYMENPDSTTILDGFILRDGLANYDGLDQPARSPYKCGGALYIMARDGWAYADIKNCTFEDNYAFVHGGAVYINGEGLGSIAPRFLNCAFRHNQSRLDGGAIYRDGSSWAERIPDFGGCLFEDNIAGRRGGGLYYNDKARSDLMQVVGCDFVKNAANTGGGANFNLARPNGGSLYLDSCVFDGNFAILGIGDPTASAYAITSFSGLPTKMISIHNCEFKNHPNTAEIILDDNIQGEIIISQSSFYNNQSGRGLIHVNYIKGHVNMCKFEYNAFNYFFSTPTINSYITNNIFKDNTTSIYFLLFVRTQPTSSNLIMNNIILDKDAILFDPIDGESNTVNELQLKNNFVNIKSLYEMPSDLTDKWVFEIKNNIISGDDGYLYSYAYTDPSSTPYEYINFDTRNNLFYSTAFCDSLLLPTSSCGTGNLFGIDPMFRDSANGDFRLLPCSPLIDAGLDAAVAGIPSDIAGQPRIQGAHTDIGPHEAAAFSSAVPVVKPACVGLSNGSINIMPLDGCPPYQVVWSPALSNDTLVSGLPPGQYQVTITDAQGRTSTQTVQVPSADNPQVSLTAQPIPCNGSVGGSIVPMVDDGTTPYQFTWSDGSTDSLRTALGVGNYELLVTDASGCRDTASADITLSGMLTLFVNGSSVSCTGLADGWLSVQPLTGKAPFVYQWSNGSMDSLITDLPPGDYSVTVTDVFGCTSTYVFPTFIDPLPLIPQAAILPTNSLTNPNGSVTAYGTGGSIPYTYLWDTGDSTQAITSLSTGFYTVTVTDNNGCTASATYEVKFMVGTANPTAQSLRFWPNPASESLYFELPEGIIPQMVTLTDKAGRTVLRTALSGMAGTQKLDLKAGTLGAGTYGIMVSTSRDLLYFGRVVVMD